MTTITPDNLFYAMCVVLDWYHTIEVATDDYEVAQWAADRAFYLTTLM